MKLPNADSAILDDVDDVGMTGIRVLGVVALIVDLPRAGLCRGQVGAVVEMLAPNVSEAELSDDDRSYAMPTPDAERLMVLRHQPVPRA